MKSRSLLRLIRVGAAALTLAGRLTGADKPATGSEKNLFDERSLAGWAQSGFEGEGAVAVDPSFREGRAAIVIEAGTTLSGITRTRGAELPRTNYEISLEAMKLKGEDFFCALTIPVGKVACTFVVGGWGGMVSGISSIDYSDASDNETTQARDYVDNRWYKIRVRVTDAKIEAWIDAEQLVDFEIGTRKLTLRPGDIQKSLPLGIATYMTRAAVREIKLRTLPAKN